jgi:hypothetical protein
VPDRLTDYMATEIAATQWQDGRGHLGGIARAPVDDGDFTRTALAIRALQACGTRARELEMNTRIDRAKRWLLHADPVTTEDRDIRLVGVSSAGETDLL